MSTSTTTGGYTFTQTDRSVYMTFVCPNCLISNLIKFTGTFRDTKGTQFGSEEKWQLLVVLCGGCCVKPEANIRSVDDVGQLMALHQDVF